MRHNHIAITTVMIAGKMGANGGSAPKDKLPGTSFASVTEKLKSLFC